MLTSSIGRRRCSVTVSMRVMSAGDGYKYLLRTVAAADGEKMGGKVHRGDDHEHHRRDDDDLAGEV